MQTIIILNGLPRAGKDTFCYYVKQYFRLKYNVTDYSSISKIKEIAKDFFGWNGIKDKKGRCLLSELKDAATRYNNMPLKLILNKIHTFFADNNNKIFIVHIREPFEIQKLKQYYENHPTIKIISVCILNKKATQYNNTGDSGIFDYRYNYFLSNNADIKHFKKIIYNFCEKEI